METSHRPMDWILTATFVLALWLPLVWTRTEPASLAERRTFAPFPQRPRTMEELVAFPKAFEKWFDDHFGLRHRLVQAYHLMTLAVGSSGSPRVLVGKDGWLYYTDPKDGNSLEDYRRTDPLTPEELDRWRVALEAKYFWLKEKGIPYLFIIAPDKHTVYPEYYPSRVRVLGSRSRLEQFMEAMDGSPVPVIDLREPLRRAKTFGRLYHKTDSHWNDLGAAVAHNTVLAHLSAEVPGLFARGYGPEDFVWRQARGGDLARMLSLQDFLKETEVPMLRPGLFRCPDYRENDPMDSEEPALIVTACRSEGKSALVFRDSFFTRLRPYITQYFAQTVCTSEPPEVETLERFVRTYNPDVVLEERVERYLKVVPKRPDPAGDPYRALRDAVQRGAPGPVSAQR
ncbi:MAG: hypothetical protein WHS86_10455 [Desulfosoma sp.]